MYAGHNSGDAGHNSGDAGHNSMESMLLEKLLNLIDSSNRYPKTVTAGRLITVCLKPLETKSRKS